MEFMSDDEKKDKDSEEIFPCSLFTPLNQISEVDEVICVGSLESAKDARQLAAHRITHILNLTDEKYAYDKDVTYMQIKLVDSVTENIGRHFEEAMKFIQEAADKKGKVLIHCEYGMSRSVSIAIAWLMYKAYLDERKLSFEEAFKIVAAARVMAAPNNRFQASLREYEKSLSSTNKENTSPRLT